MGQCPEPVSKAVRDGAVSLCQDRLSFLWWAALGAHGVKVATGFTPHIPFSLGVPPPPRPPRPWHPQGTGSDPGGTHKMAGVTIGSHPSFFLWP